MVHWIDPFLLLNHMYDYPWGQELLKLQVAKSAQEFLVSNRPREEEKFSGDGGNIDFESTLARFHLVTAQTNASSLQQFMEIKEYSEAQINRNDLLINISLLLVIKI